MSNMGFAPNVASSDAVTRTFVELWHKRVAARIRLLQISIYLSIGWIIFCAALTAANWTTIGQDVGAHPKSWVALLVVCMLMQIPGDLVWGGLAPAPQTGRAERSKENHGGNGRKKLALKPTRLTLSDNSITSPTTTRNVHRRSNSPKRKYPSSPEDERRRQKTKVAASR
jgi:hypothetical protein